MVNEQYGGPAFPLVYDEGVTRKVLYGMTLRDYFAAKVCAALCQYEEFPADNAAKKAYEYADAMLKQRGKL